MTKLIESDIEEMAMEELAKVGYRTLYAPDTIEPRGIDPQRNYKDVLLDDSLTQAIERINPTLTADQVQSVVKQVKNLQHFDITSNNLDFHRKLTEGIIIETSKDGIAQGKQVWLIDWQNLSNNEFLAINQITIRHDQHERRPDIILYINGLPLVVIELKNASDPNTTIHSAYQQLTTYQREFPHLFAYNAFNIISDGFSAQVGTLSSDFTRYMTWKTRHGKAEAKRHDPQLNVMIEGLLKPEVLLDVIQHFIVFEQSKTEDKSGVISITHTKKIAAYHQYYAVKTAVERTLNAANVQGNKKAGVVWHTQGSGKSLTMVFYVGEIVLQLNNPTIVVLTDRNDLDDQLYNTFSAAKQLLRQEPKQAEAAEDLKKLLKVNSGGIVFTTIQKFQADSNTAIHELLSDRHNIVVIADEAHRSQYGFVAKEVDIKNAQGEVTGKRTAYGFAKYIRDALPNATYLGFTGTPIEKDDVNTPAVFGDYIDIYDISQAVEDGATVRIYYESRLAKVNISEEGKKLINEFDEKFNEDELTLTQQERSKWVTAEALIGSADRIKAVAQDIVNHFDSRLHAYNGQGKGMIVAMSRRIAVALYEEIVKLRPDWGSDDLYDGVVKVVITSSAADGATMSAHHTTKKQREILANRMKNDDDKLKLVIVRDMWLTGFDAPSMHTLYIDKPMKGHNLMQAIARVNRVHKDKIGGLVVDYLGIAADLKEALSFYSEAGGTGEPADIQENAVVLLQEKLEVIDAMLYGFDYARYFTASTAEKLSIILEAEDFILGIDQGEGKKRFLTAVAAMSKAFALATPHPTAMEVAPIVAFFQTIKARLVKFGTGEGGDGGEDSPTNVAVETQVKQIIDQALVNEKVIDVFEAAGIQKPDISILSDEFMAEMRDYTHKNIALETLKKLLAGEIKTRQKTSAMKGKKLMEMLDSSLHRYHNKILTAAQVIEELINLAKEIKTSDKLAEELNLSEYEYAFYLAVADNDSATELMGQDQLKELAIVLTQTIIANLPLDYNKKKAAQAKIRAIVKRLLNKYGFPPDKQALATELVMEQTETIAEQLVA